MSNLISWSGSNPTYQSPDSSVAGAGARGQPERAGSIGSRARAFAFVAKAGSAPRVMRAQVRQTVRLLKSSLAMPPRADRLRMASHRELVAECRRLFRASRQDYGVPIAGQVARIGACLERLCALQGDASTVTRTALMHGVVARALGTRNVGQLLRSGRGLGEHRTLTSAEEDFKRGQLKDAKVPEAVRQRIAQSLERRMGGDSPMLRLIRESVALHAAEQVGALPTDQLKALNKALVEENDQLILAARQRKSGAVDGGQG